MTICDVVAERVALGEPLGDAADHAETCPKCRTLVALPTELGATRREVDPGLGFAARMTAGAQHRFTVRRRRRIAAGMAAVVAAAAAFVFVLTRASAKQQLAVSPETHQQLPATNPHDENKPDPWSPKDNDGVDEDVKSLVQMASSDHHASADWKRIEGPLEPYRSLLQGVEP